MSPPKMPEKSEVKWESDLEEVFERLLKRVPLEYKLPYMPILLKVRESRSEALKDFINGVEEFQRMSGDDYAINQNKWHDLCELRGD